MNEREGAIPVYGEKKPNTENGIRLQQLAHWMDKLKLPPEDLVQIPRMRARGLHRFLAKRAKRVRARQQKA